jgi:bile acid:Na+ symporter, BASS family
MTANQVINILATVTLLQMMVTIGLGVTPGDVLGVARDWRMLARAAVANYLLVPAVAVGLLLLLQAKPMIAAGFLIAAVCPGAPYGPPFTAMAKGDQVLAVGLMVILAGSSAILAPLLLGVLLPLMGGDEPLTVDGGKIVATLLVSQLLPLGAGLYLRQQHPKMADKLVGPFTSLSKLLNLALIAVILAVQFRMLAQIRLTGYVGMLALVTASVAAGWLLGGPGRDGRKTLAITTSVRNVGVGLVIATASFGGTPAVAATTAFALFQTLFMALVALWWGKLASPQIAVVEQVR